MPEGRGDRGVDVRDRVVHGLGDGAVAGVALAGAAQLGEVHRLARVEVQHVADAVAEAQRVRGGVGQAGVAQALVLRAGAVQRALVERRRSRPATTSSGTSAPRSGVSALPLDGEHPVALEVAERAVVGDDLEAVAQRLEAAARAVAAVRALADEVGEHRRARPRPTSASHGGQRRAPRARRRPRRAARRAAGPRRRPRARAGPTSASRRCVVAVQAEPLDPAPLGGAALAQVVDPDVAAARALHARDEARHDGLDRLQQLPAARARLGQRMREQVHDQLLVRLAARVDAHVRQRRGGQQPAQQVQRLGLDRAPPRPPRTRRRVTG